MFIKRIPLIKKYSENIRILKKMATVVTQYWIVLIMCQIKDCIYLIKIIMESTIFIENITAFLLYTINFILKTRTQKRNVYTHSKIFLNLKKEYPFDVTPSRLIIKSRTKYTSRL